MEVFIPNELDYQFINYLMTWGYWGIFVWFMTFDNVTPVPQEISLLVIGYLSAGDWFNPYLAALTCIFAFIIIDIVYYKLSYAGNKIIIKFYKKNQWIEKYSDKLEKHMGKTLYTLCFLPRMRFLSPILVGLLNLSFRKFLFYDILSISTFSLIYISIGNIFHQTLSDYIPRIDNLIFKIFILAMVVTIFALARLIILNRQNSLQNEVYQQDASSEV